MGDEIEGRDSIAQGEMADCEDGVHHDNGYCVCTLCGVNLPKIVQSPVVKSPGRVSRLNFDSYPQIDREWRLSAEKFAAERQVHSQKGYPRVVKELYCLIGSAHQLGRSVISLDVANRMNVSAEDRQKLASFSMQLAIRTDSPPIRTISASLEDLPLWLEKLKGLGGLGPESAKGIQELGTVLSNQPEFKKLPPTEAIAVCIGSYWSSRLGYAPPIERLADSMGLNKTWLRGELDKY